MLNWQMTGKEAATRGTLRRFIIRFACPFHQCRSSSWWHAFQSIDACTLYGRHRGDQMSAMATDWKDELEQSIKHAIAGNKNRGDYMRANVEATRDTVAGRGPDEAKI